MKPFLLSLFISIFTFSQISSQAYHLLVGTYTNTGKSEGIYTYSVDIQSGKTDVVSVAKPVLNPSYLCVAPDRKFIYAVNQNENTSSISSFSFDTRNGKLTQLNRVNASGSGPCYISCTKNHVFTANYSDGSLCVFARNTNGTLTESIQQIQHTGSSVNPERQKESHVHQIVVSPDNKYLIVNDLGTDFVTVYKYNPNSHTEVLIAFDSLKVKSGSGPRHIVFNKKGEKIYLVQEIDGTVTVLGCTSGKLKIIQETSVVKNNQQVNRGADIYLSGDDKFLYVSNRGTANDISCFSVKNDGQLSFLNQIPTGGNGPRNFALTPDGKYVFIAHQFSDNICIFSRNPRTGFLTSIPLEIKVGAPVCLVFY